MREITNNIDRKKTNCFNNNKFMEIFALKNFTDKITYCRNTFTGIMVLRASMQHYFKVVTNTFVILLLCLA